MVGLFGYTSIAYCLYGDIIVFNEQLQNLELIGITIILLMNITLIVKKVMNQPEKESKRKDQK